VELVGWELPVKAGKGRSLIQFSKALVVFRIQFLTWFHPAVSPLNMDPNFLANDNLEN
jgi:hypothetical protein